MEAFNNLEHINNTKLNLSKISKHPHATCLVTSFAACSKALLDVLSQHLTL
jgi:hypothetical protein